MAQSEETLKIFRQTVRKSKPAAEKEWETMKNFCFKNLGLEN